MKLTDVDRYGVELHNPEITVPSGSGDVPRTNYLTLAALAVMRGQIQKNQMEDFVRSPRHARLCADPGTYSLGDCLLGHAKEALAMRAIAMRCLLPKAVFLWPDDAAVGWLSLFG